MDTRHYRVIVEWDPEERVWVTYVPELNYLSTYGETRDEALEMTRDAIVGYLEAVVQEGVPLPAGGQEFEVVDVEVALA